MPPSLMMDWIDLHDTNAANILGDVWTYCKNPQIQSQICWAFSFHTFHHFTCFSKTKQCIELQEVWFGNGFFQGKKSTKWKDMWKNKRKWKELKKKEKTWKKEMNKRAEMKKRKRHGKKRNDVNRNGKHESKKQKHMKNERAEGTFWSWACCSGPARNARLQLSRVGKALILSLLFGSGRDQCDHELAVEARWGTFWS